MFRFTLQGIDAAADAATDAAVAGMRGTADSGAGPVFVTTGVRGGVHEVDGGGGVEDDAVNDAGIDAAGDAKETGGEDDETWTCISAPA